MMLQKSTKQTTSEKILWGIFDLLELTDNIWNNPLSTWRLYDKLYRGGYGEIIKKINWQKSRQQFAQFINLLKRRGYIKMKIEKDTKTIILTPKGFEKVLNINLKQSSINGKKRRDGKWQMIIWDIPENYKKTRERFRAALKLLGYQQLQKSVWVCSDDVLKETERLTRFYGIEPYIKLFLISEIEV